MPTPSSTMPVARQLPSRLCQCRAKSARRTPTWDPSALPGCGRRRSFARLLAHVIVGSLAGSPAGASSKGQFLSHSSLSHGGRRPRPSKTEVLVAVFLDDVTFVLDLDSRCFWAKVTDKPAILSACLIVRTRFWGTMGSGPTT